MRVLAVCLGNICRSPTAEAALQEAAAAAQVSLYVESAGTAAFHVGRSPDPRMTSAAAAAGLVVEGSARQVSPADFTDFDVLLAMDRANFDDLVALAPHPDAAAKVRLFRDFDPQAAGSSVPDPYYGGMEGFQEVVSITRRAAQGFVAALMTGGL